MRISRKAGLLTFGVAWVKYEYNNVLVKDLTDYTLSEWEIIETGTTQSSFQGYKTYYIGTATLKNYTYYDFTFADSAVINLNQPGTVYKKNYNSIEGQSIIRQISIDSDGDYTILEQTMTSSYTNERYEMRPDTKVGTVYAAEGEYPDAKNGYTYVETTDDGYIIMEDSSGNQYAYLQA